MVQCNCCLQFRILLWRCWIIKFRQPLLTTFEIILPLLLPLILSTINHFDTKGERGKFSLVENKTYEPTNIYLNFTNIPQTSFGLLYSPQSEFTKGLMDRILNNTITVLNISVAANRTSEQMIRTLRDKVAKNDDNFTIGGVLFEVDPNMNRAPYKFNYSLLMTQFDQENALFPKKIKAGPNYENDTSNAYFSSLFVIVQTLVNGAYLQLLAEQEEEPTKDIESEFRKWFSINKYPYPRYIESPHMYSAKLFIARSNVLGFIALCPILLKLICTEKERRIKEMMKLMGMNDFLYYLSIFISQIALAAILSVVVTGFYYIHYPGGKPLLERAAPTIVYATLLMYSITITLFFMACSAMFNKPINAMVFGLIIHLTSFELPLQLMKKPGSTAGVGAFIVPEEGHLAVCLLPNMALEWAFTIIIENELYIQGSSFKTLFTTTPSLELMTLGYVYLMMGVTCIFSVFFLWYVEAIWPWQYGASKPIYFPFQPSYWAGFRKIREHNLVEEPPTVVDESYFEKEPQLQPILVATKLYKTFGGLFFKKVCVHDVTLTIYQGQITVLLGHNGAGKTTTMNMLTGLLCPTRGSVVIDGYDIVYETRQARKLMGLCPQHNVLYDNLTVSEHLYLYGILKKEKPVELRKQIIQLLKDLKLEDKINTRAAKLSGGMKRKLSLAIAMLGHPKLLVLDEPTAGMDPEARRGVWDLLLKVRRKVSILLTTHHMEESDVLGDRIAIMSEGKVKCYGTSLFLKRRFGAGYHLTFAKTESFNKERLNTLFMAFLPHVNYASETKTEIVYTLDTQYIEKLGPFFVEFDKYKDQIGISSCGVTVTTMEDVFLQVGSTFKNIKGFVSPAISQFTSLPREEHHGHRKPAINFGKEAKAKGFELWVQQFIALFLKRTHFSIRYIPTLATQIFIPGVVILILTQLQNMVVKSLDTEGFTLDLDLEMKYGKTQGFVYVDLDLEILNETERNKSIQLIESYKDELTANKVKYEVLIGPNSSPWNGSTKVESPDHYLLQNAKDVNVYFRKYLVGASFTDQGNQSLVTAWYNGEALHAMPISIQIAFKAFQRHIIQNVLEDGDTEYSMGITNRPFPRKAFYKQWFNVPEVGRYMYLSLVPVSMSMISAAFILFPIHERVSKAKLVQLMTGVPHFLFWFAHFIFDMLMHILACTLVILAFYFWDSNRILFLPHHAFVAVTTLLLLYGFSIIPMVYLFSFACENTGTGFAVILIICLIFGLVLGFIMYLLLVLVGNEVIKRWQLDIVLYFARLFPLFSLSWGIQNLFYNGGSEMMCSKIEKPQLNYTCEAFEAKRLKEIRILGCCPNKCVECYNGDMSVFNWKPNGISPDVLMLFVDGLINWSILLLVESNCIAKLKRRFRKEKPPSQGNSDKITVVRKQSKTQDKEDDDVVNERIYVDKLVQNNEIDKEAIVISTLTKHFKELTAVSGISLAIHKQEFFGFLGINGAGKTTTFSMLTGDIIPSEGNAYIGKANLLTSRKAYCSSIGYCPQFDPILDRLTGREMLYLIARLRGVKNEMIGKQVNPLLEMVDLAVHADKQTMNYSGGNRRKLSLAMAIVGSPKVVFLDEPTAGVDSESRRKMWATLIDLQEMTKCAIVLTSHTMDECEALCNRLTVMVNGKLRCLGSTQHLRSKFGQGFTVIVKMKQDNLQDKEYTNKVNIYIAELFPSAVLKDEHETLLHYHISDPNTPWSTLFLGMEGAKKDLDLEDYQISDTTLEQIFLAFARGQRRTDKTKLIASP